MPTNVQILLGQLGLAALGVPEVGVAAVDDDVARVEQRRQLGQHGVDRDAGFDHQDDLPWPRQRGDQLGQRGDAGDARCRRRRPARYSSVRRVVRL